MITSHPMILVPQLIVAILSLALNLVVASRNALAGLLVLGIVNLVVVIIVSGAYPEMVQNILAGSPISISRSLRMAAGRFGSLIVAGILVGLLEAVGFIAIIVPGI